MATTKKSDNIAKQAFAKSLVIALMIIPTAVSIFMALKIRNITEVNTVREEPQIVCFDKDMCAIEVRNKWYQIEGIINMDTIIPEEYQFNDLIEISPDSNDSSVDIEIQK